MDGLAPEARRRVGGSGAALSALGSIPEPDVPSVAYEHRASRNGLSGPPRGVRPRHRAGLRLQEQHARRAESRAVAGWRVGAGGPADRRRVQAEDEAVDRAASPLQSPAGSPCLRPGPLLRSTPRSIELRPTPT